MVREGRASPKIYPGGLAHGKGSWVRWEQALKGNITGALLARQRRASAVCRDNAFGSKVSRTRVACVLCREREEMRKTPCGPSPVPTRSRYLVLVPGEGMGNDDLCFQILLMCYLRGNIVECGVFSSSGPECDKDALPMAPAVSCGDPPLAVRRQSKICSLARLVASPLLEG
ncbi:hypothetical protein NDU88_005275 [Pleurodeles waltl]|uniref:Uncharacterized protein n=1 Tax=Pleurodeles waltl TaxID=8319 RepID=A0AAV7TAI6_PLEWA|nr:hypothetical protein NDU88_005275 [Pleurodeles waltl]